MTNELAAWLKERIAAEGPMRFDRFMALANAAYYGSRDPFGKRGDFVTAPEASQAFGECLGLWAAVAWTMLGRPDPCLLVELGPGRGTLMADALRAIGQASPGFARALRVHLVEQSERLREVQRETLPCPATWHDGPHALPQAPSILIANEFLDALPVRRFLRSGQAWREVAVGLGDGGRLVEALVEASVGPGDALALPARAEEGATREIGCAAREAAGILAERIARSGGAALLVDYGHGGVPVEVADGTTLTALARHRVVDPLAEPGEADLSAQVDFAGLAEAVRQAGAAAQGPVPQGMFLTRLGFLARTQALLRSAKPSQRAELEAAARRLVAPSSMGLVYRAMAIAPVGLPALPGFEAT